MSSEEVGHPGNNNNGSAALGAFQLVRCADCGVGSEQEEGTTGRRRNLLLLLIVCFVFLLFYLSALFMEGAPKEVGQWLLMSNNSSAEGLCRETSWGQLLGQLGYPQKHNHTHTEGSPRGLIGGGDWIA